MKTGLWNFVFCVLSFNELKAIVFSKKTLFFKCILVLASFTCLISSMNYSKCFVFNLQNPNTLIRRIFPFLMSAFKRRGNVLRDKSHDNQHRELLNEGTNNGHR